MKEHTYKKPDGATPNIVQSDKFMEFKKNNGKT